jgi:hypothetical protein
MTPEEYLKNCCDPGQPVGALWCQIEEDKNRQGWTMDQVTALKHAVLKRYNEGCRFPFPKEKVRYV